MPKRFHCPQGHHWEETIDLHAGVKTPPAQCPVCGGAGETKPVPDPLLAASTVLASPPSQQSSPSTTRRLVEIPGYEVLGLLGEGTMGQVYKARHVRLDRLVALKVIRADRLSNPDTLRRFQREARAIARLAHPHVVSVYDAGEANGRHFLAMEYVEGTDLAWMVQERGPLPVAQACDFVRQAALGLQHAHERGLVHRDLKPANLLVTLDGSVVKVLDLGLARLGPTGGPGEPPSMLTTAGNVMGTPAFLAPEQATDAARADIRSDIYSLGCTLYFLLTAQVPFSGAGVMDVLLKHQLEKSPLLASVRPEIPPGLQDLVSKTLAKRPEERYQTPAELAAALEPFCRRSAESATSAVRETDPIRHPEGRPGRHWWVLIGGTAAALILGSLVWMALHRTESAVPTSMQVQSEDETTKPLPPGDPKVAESAKSNPPDPKGAVTSNNRGFAHYKKREYDKAVEDYSEAIKLNPRFAVAYNNRGLAHAAKEDYEKAIDDYNVAIQLNPKYALAYTNRGDAYYERKKNDKAIEDYDEAIKLDPKNATAHNNRGLAYAASGDYERAIDDYSSSIELDPEFALAYFNRSAAYRMKGDEKRAETDRKKAVSLDPSLAK